MTIRFLKPWNGYQPDAVVSGLTNESALIAGGLASYDLDGGNDGRTYEAKLATDASGNVTGLVGPTTGYEIRLPMRCTDDKLRRTKSKIAKAHAAPVNILVVGHSVVSGAYANDATASADATWQMSGFVGVMRRYFDAVYGSVSPGALFPAENPATNFTLGGGATITGGNLSDGPGGWRVNLNNSAYTCSVTGTGKTLRVYGFSTASGAQARYTLDGGSLTNAATTSSGAMPNGNYWYVFDIDLGTNASHTVVLTGPASGNYYVYGVQFLSDTTKGVVCHRAGWSGKVITDLIALSLDGTDTAGPAWRTTLNANQKTEQHQSITTKMGVDLMVVMTDVNDLTGGWTNYAYTLADIQRHLQNLVTVNSAANVDTLLVCGPWRNPSSYGSGVPFTQSEVIAQYKAVADANDRCDFLNLAANWDDYTDMDSAGLMHDSVHPSSLGHAVLGRKLAEFIML